MTSARLEAPGLKAGSATAHRSSDPEAEATQTARIASFDAFVALNQVGLVRYATLLSGSATHGEDLVQEVLARLFPRWEVITGRVGSHHAYVRRAVTNEYLSWRRRWSTRNIHLVDDEVLNQVAEDPWSGMHEDGLWRALQDLPRQQRAALVLRYYEGLTDAEISEVFGCQQVTVRVYISRGLTTLRDHAGIALIRKGDDS